ETSWERFRELFLGEYAAGKRKNTRLNYEAALDAFEELCSPRRVSSINARTVSAFAAALRAGGKTHKPAKASTVAVRLQFLRTALRWASDQGMLATVPKFPKVDVPDRKPQPVPAESFERLLAAAGDDLQMRAYLLSGWHAGLRLNEALALEWEPTDSAPW